MKPHEIFLLYADERKAAVPTGYKADAVSGLTRYTPTAPALDGIVTFSELVGSSVDDAISAQIDYFRTLDLPFEWKVYEFDTPEDLASRLAERGFTPGDHEGFLVFSVDMHRPREGTNSLRIDRITTPSGIRQVVTIQEAIWGRSFPWLESSLLASLDRLAVYCAYLGDAPVGTGWIEFTEGTTFAELHGGAVLPARRGHGIYSALFDIRVTEAKRRGFHFLAVDAAPMSRPILLQKGFTYICDTIPFRRRANQ
jgi:GNAT superfamily N-acetyltransferase